ncbi:MAG: DUF4301 family protein [Bacteroidetes bacterium]|nr:DUF4301 family protein [Bacteroidota bacterium]
MTQLNDKDLQQIKQKGIDKLQIDKQITSFVKGFPYVKLVAPATVSSGLLALSPHEVDQWIRHFDEQKDRFNLLKFVPASGAASRMFKHLFEFLQEFDGSEATVAKLSAEAGFNTAAYFIQHIRKLAFFNSLSKKLDAAGSNIDELLNNKAYDRVIEFLLSDDGLGYANLPKALLEFHAYPAGSRLALEEHLIEAFHYTTDEHNVARVHLTISPEHRSRFEEEISRATALYEKLLGVRFEISLSEQKSSTDTIAVDLNNEPFRNEDGSLLFRPGGHGALIENLNDLEEDIIFIKNIDNIVPDRLRNDTYRYKKALAGLLIDRQDKTWDYLDLLDSGNLMSEEIEEIRRFAAEQLMIAIPPAFDGLSEIEKIDYLFVKLNRPIRVCGMVKNEGEPGGGPFWIENTDGEVSLQIIESSQMDLKNKQQSELIAKSTHFNPVDLICGMYDFQGNKFDLKEYIDEETGFISLKSKDGRDLKALELPGLWNGAMADWITIFVETPIITFNPVKTVNDLLRPQHQPA